MVWQRYLTTTLRAQPDEVAGITFRDKSVSGWRRYDFVAQMATSTGGGSVRQFYGDNIYMRGFLHDLYLRPSCHACMAKGGRSQSDLTLGDYWGVERTCPGLERALDGDRGTSVVLVHSERGATLLAGAACRYQATNYASALTGNPSIEQSAKEPPQRQTFFERIDEEPLSSLITRLTATPWHKRLWRRLHHRAHLIKLRARRLL